MDVNSSVASRWNLPLAGLAKPAHDRALIEGRTYLRLKESAEIRQSRPADRRRHPGVRHHHAVVHPHLPERDPGGRLVLGRALDDQPAALRRRPGLRGAGHACATVLLGRPLVELNYKQSDREADFRAILIHVRDDAESIALSRREGRLRAGCLRRVDELVENYRRITSVNSNT